MHTTFKILQFLLKIHFLEEIKLNAREVEQRSGSGR